MESRVALLTVLACLLGGPFGCAGSEAGARADGATGADTPLELVDDLRQGRWEARVRAAESLRQKEEHEDALRQPLMRLLETGDAEAALAASYVLVNHDHKALADSLEAEANLSRYIKAVKKGHPIARVYALYAIMSLGPKAAAAVPAIINFIFTLEHVEEEGHRALGAMLAASSVMSMGEAAFPGLVNALRSDDPKVRCLAADLLGNFTNRFYLEGFYKCTGREFRLPAEAIPPLLEMVKSEDPHLRTCAVPLLGKYGPRAKAAVPHLLALIESGQVEALPRDGANGREQSSEGLRRVVEEALEEINPDALRASE